MPQKLSPLSVIDMKKEPPSTISYALAQKVKELKSKEQAIIFAHRRGIATAIICAPCGKAIQCELCSCPMAKHEKFLLCPVCSKKTNIPLRCVQCGSEKLKDIGAGTAFIERAVKKLNPNISVLRMDYDSARTKKEQEAMLKEFAENKSQIIVGSIALINNHDLLPRVKWACVALLDTSLSLPVYNASEQTFLTIWRLRQRAKEETLLQTYIPESNIFNLASASSVKPFINNQLALRKELNAPPFKQIIQLVYEDKDEKKVKQESLSLKKTLEEYIVKNEYKNVEILGPAPAYHEKKLGKTRQVIIMRYPKNNSLLTVDIERRNKILSLIPISWDVTVDQ